MTGPVQTEEILAASPGYFDTFSTTFKPVEHDASSSNMMGQMMLSPLTEPSPLPFVMKGHRNINTNGLYHRYPSIDNMAPTFEDKWHQMRQVKQIIRDTHWIPHNKIDDQIDWFYNGLGIDDVYFETESVTAVASHITSLYAARIAASIRQGGSEDRQEGLGIEMEAVDHAIYIDTSEPGKIYNKGPRYEQRLESRYLDACLEKPFRVESFRSSSGLNVSSNSKATIRCYFVYQCRFVEPNPDPEETRIEVIADKMFLRKATQKTLKIYQEVIDLAVARTGPVIDVFPVGDGDSGEKRLVIAFRQRTALGIFSALSDLYHFYGVTSARKYVEQFSNGITVISVYLKAIDSLDARFPSMEHSMHQITKEVSLLYCIPQNKFQSFFISGALSLQETMYGHCVWVFAQHFLNRLGPEYVSLLSALDPNNGQHAEILANIKRRLHTETFTADYIREIIGEYPKLLRLCYANFANKHYKPLRDFALEPAVSDAQLKEQITRTVSNEHEATVWEAFRTFNSSILKTNYYIPTKVALSFRLDPSFLSKIEYPQPLFGMFLVISSESRGFHLRFRDIARGGIRIVKSRNREAYSINARSLFDENYGLANTQQRKNKDIPEGGSKGVILLDDRHQDKGSVAFEKYIDSIMDLLLPSVGSKGPIVDLYGLPEILFMGPDENTADLVDWATEHARARGAPWWKSFFTGKSPKLGGIPHDAYGMTTLSVREYVTGIYKKLGLDPSKVRKMQTGGPDGDLGSNEIILSGEKYTSIIDGSGVLVDPNGINRQELLRLARKRAMISEFDISKLSSSGYRVLIDEVNVKLPSGEVIDNGMTFRNTFHLRDTGMTDCFVPCGGRPESIDLMSVSKLIKDGKSIIPYIVEGANLFVTQEAKLRLEAAGCIIYKDASTNKGGVTSSSLEVLASLSFDDAGFIEHMCVAKDGKAPEFYRDYVTEVQDIIRRNARLEFEAIWKEHESSGIPRSILSDNLSMAITRLDEELQATGLWHNEAFKRSVLKDALPSLLLNKIGLDLIMKRVPENYLRSIFGSYLASRFVYEFGSNPSQWAFFSFITKRITVSVKEQSASSVRHQQADCGQKVSFHQSKSLGWMSAKGTSRFWIVILTARLAYGRVSQVTSACGRIEPAPRSRMFKLAQELHLRHPVKQH